MLIHCILLSWIAWWTCVQHSRLGAYPHRAWRSTMSKPPDRFTPPRKYSDGANAKEGDSRDDEWDSLFFIDT
jgi:hypothetical protein